MSHLASNLLALPNGQGQASWSRRSLLRGGFALGLAFSTRVTVPPTAAQAALAVRVAAPRISRTNDCQATVSVDISLSAVPSERHYLLYGDILESDTKADDAEYCCTLHPQRVVLVPGQTHLLTLIQHAMAVDLGLVRGAGPAANEDFSPDLVELFARIWLRELATDEVLGPWDSPQRIAVSRSLPGSMPSASLLGNPLMTPRGPASAAMLTSDGQPLPPLPCSS